MMVFIVIGLFTTVITIGLGYWSYVLGKRGKTNLIGSIIPGGYFAIRAVFAITLSEGTHELVAGLVGSLAIAIIFVGVFVWGKQRGNGIAEK